MMRATDFQFLKRIARFGTLFPPVVRIRILCEEYEERINCLRSEDKDNSDEEIVCSFLYPSFAMTWITQDKSQNPHQSRNISRSNLTWMALKKT